MDTTSILPVLDMEEIRKKANEYAMKGAIQSLENYYTGYNSPFRKAIDEELSKIELRASGIALPDIIGLINDSLSAEIDRMANAAVAKSFVPLVSRFLVRESKEIKFSDILKEFIETADQKDMEDFDITMKKSNHGWYDIEIDDSKRVYQITLHQDWDSKNEQIQKYQLLNLPYRDNLSTQKMKLSIGDGELELPFIKDVLQDPFTSYIARLVIANSKITMDQTGFTDDMFPERCHCD